MSGLSLESRQSVLLGGERGPAVVPGEPDRSLLVQGPAPNGRAEDAAGRIVAEPRGGRVDPLVRAGLPGRGGRRKRPTRRTFPLGLSTARTDRSSPGEAQGMGPQPHRPLRPGPAGSQSNVAFARSRSADAHSPRQPRSDRACPRLPAKSPSSWPIPGPAPTSAWSIACWIPPIMGSVGDAIGSTSPAMRTPTATPATVTVPCGNTAIG